MTRDESLTSSDAVAWGIIVWQCAFTVGSILLSTSGSSAGWAVGQLLLSFNMVQWFILLHDLSHGAFFRTKWLNHVFGHVASVFCLVPFYPWSLMHEQHHLWNGWKDRDPSDARAVLKKPSAGVIRFMNFCWKHWIPVITLGFVAINFWTLPRLFARFSDVRSRLKATFSIAFMVAVGVAAFLVFGPGFLAYWLPAVFLLLSWSDPLLLTQHAHIDANYAAGADVKVFRFGQQGSFARTVVYPRFVAKYFFYHSEQHVLHHQHPEIPMYRLDRLPSPPENSIRWSDWLKSAKRLPADVLIFQTAQDTGVRI